MLPLAKPGLWAAGAVALALVIVFGSLVPGSFVAPVSVYDKLEHVGAYLLLTMWLTGMVERRHYPRTALAALLLGGALELAQGSLTVTREPDWADVAANALGVGTALMLAVVGLGGWALRVESLLGWKRG